MPDKKYSKTAAHTPIWVIDIDQSSVPWCNQAARALLGGSLTELQSGARSISPRLQRRLSAYLAQYDDGDPVPLQWRFNARNGQVYVCLANVIYLGNGRRGLSVEARELSEVQALPHISESSRTEYVGGVFPIAELSSLSAGVFDIHGNCLEQNDFFIRRFGVVKQIRELFAVSSAATSFLQGLLTGESAVREIRLSTQEGVRWHRVEVIKTPDTHRFSLLMADIQEQRDHETALFKVQNYDPLTGLPNRHFLYQQLEKILGSAEIHERKVGVLYLDLDGFKVVNDTFGHRVGDELLAQVAQRMKSCMPNRACLYRLGGDEFVVVLDAVDSILEVEQAAQRIMQFTSAAYPVSGMEMLITASIGIACYPQQGKDVDTLLQHADSAMYRAKAVGHNTYRIYEDTMAEPLSAHLTLGGGLRKAIEEEQFELFYQPKIRLSDQLTVGAEALIRWVHPELGLISPDKFIPLAEESGLILPLGEWVIRRACRQLQEWREMGYEPISLSVNLSGRQFMQADLVDMVKDVLDETGVDPKYLELELTESMLMADARETIEKLHGFRQLGLSLSIDDFGTGYSSLAYLKKFPIQSLKIDRSFVRDLGMDADDDAIVKATIAMANSLNLKVIAEGVENLSQLDALNGYQCQEVQGFYFARPMSSIDFSRYMDAQSMRDSVGVGMMH